MVINKSEVEFYKRNGFLKIDNFFSISEVIKIRQYIQEAMSIKSAASLHNSSNNRTYYKQILNQKVNVWLDHDGLMELAFNKDLAEIAAKLSESNLIKLFQDQILIKEPTNSKPTPWHQDLCLWPMAESKALTAWIALDDVNEDNGCMQFIPASHKLGKITHYDYNNPQKTFNSTTSPVIMRMKAGSLHFHNSLTFHYAFANTSLQPRIAYAIIYIPSNTTYNGLPYPITDHQNLIIGEEIKGSLFPVLYKK